MKKAIKITSIIYIPLLALTIVIGFLFGVLFMKYSGDQEFITELASESNLTNQEVSATLTVYGTYLITMAIFMIPGLVIDILILNHIKKEDSGERLYSKANWIVFGVLGYLLGAAVPGVLCFIWAFVRKGEQHSDPNVQEVHYEEKAEEGPKPSDYDAPEHLDE